MGLITKNTYLNTSAFKGLRKKLLQSFDKVYVFNLHGKLYEKAPNGGKDQNVFDIRVGTAILICVKNGKKKANELAKLNFAELYGDRESKYKYLAENRVSTTNFEQLVIDPEYFFFEKKTFNETELYNSFIKFENIFISSNSGVKTGRDHFITDRNKTALRSRLQSFLNSTLPLDMLKEAYVLDDASSFNLKKAKDKFKSIDDSLIIDYCSKPFENKFIYYEGIFVDRLGDKVNGNLLKKNEAIILKKRNADSIYNSVFITKNVTDINFLGGQSYIFPLWIYEGEGGLFGASKKSNINVAFEATIEKLYRKKDLTEEIFYYIYAVLYCPKYREAFAEQLQIDYPKVPFTNDYKLFKTISEIGKSLSELHLLTSKELSKPFIKFNGKGNNKVTEIDFKETDKQLFINPTQYFTGINKEMWEWEVGKNKPIQRWIKNAKDKELGLNETIEFGKICSAIKLTFDKQAEVDKQYEIILSKLWKKN